MCLILFFVMSIFYQMEDEGGKIRSQEISGHATNQTFLHIDHAQSMLVRLQFRYPSLIKLLSTQPSCLNVQLTSALLYYLIGRWAPLLAHKAIDANSRKLKPAV